MQQPTYLIDYLQLAFRLGHLSASLGEAYGDPSIVEEWRDEIDELAENMDALGLPASKQFVISFLEQVGDLDQQPDVLDILTGEADANLKAVLDGIRRDVEELRSRPGELPAGVRDVVTPRLLDALPEDARQEYEEAKRNLLAGTWTSAVRSACVAVESTLGALYGLVKGMPPDAKTWDEMQRALAEQDSLDGKHPQYVVAPVRDIQKNYRNPTAHPGRRVLDDAEAYATFYHCAVALRRMGEAILTRTMPGG